MLRFLHKYANPVRFNKTVEPFKFYFAIFASSLIVAGLILGLFFAPPDYLQSYSVRIMYIHVPSAWLSLAAYFNIFLFSMFYIIWKFPIFLIISKESASIGCIFTIITMFTGSLWGKPTWGTYWVWDARLTSFFILFFIYLGLILVKSTNQNGVKNDKVYAYLAMIGGVNLPIIKFSVDWWNTLHQPASVFRLDGPTISPEMLYPLLIMASGFFFLYLFLLLTNVSSHLDEKKLILLKQNIKI